MVASSLWSSLHPRDALWELGQHLNQTSSSFDSEKSLIPRIIRVDQKSKQDSAHRELA